MDHPYFFPVIKVALMTNPDPLLQERSLLAAAGGSPTATPPAAPGPSSPTVAAGQAIAALAGPAPSQ
jgi:hypothetical protein